jgi:hypothetical protein
MRKAGNAFLMFALFCLSAHCSAAFHKGEKFGLKDGGMVCRSLDGAIATRDVVITNEQGGKVDMIEATRPYSCLSYSIRPLTFVKYDDYLIPGYPEKGKQFASVIEPRSGVIWHIFTEFLDSTK